ncbi:MAG: DUF1189 domain-containing protein [Wujia sp.]
MTFAEQIFYAMFKPSKYKELIELRKGKSVKFIIILMLVLGIATYAVPVSAFVAGFGGFEKLFKQRIGNIEYSNGELKDDRKFDISFQGVYFIIDTSENEVSPEKFTKDGITISFGKKMLKMTMVSGSTKVDYQKINYWGVLPEGLNNEALCDFIPAIYIYFVFAFIIVCIGFFIKYSIFALVLGLAVNSMSKKLEIDISFGQCFMMCMYGQTLGMILSNFNSALSFLPELLVSAVAVIISLNMITSALVSMKHPTNE